MSKQLLTIGQLSRRTGLPVKTLRFWSDEGVLLPAGRSPSGYRLYGEHALVRLDLVRTLREAGLGLDAIKRVLRRDLSLADALRLRLAAVEAHAVTLQRVAASLRAALRSGEPTEEDVRRICAVTRLTNEERKAVIEGFYERVSEGTAVDDAWKRRMVEASAPRLPDQPTSAQLDAWIELAELVSDAGFIETLCRSAGEAWSHKIDLPTLRAINEEVAAAAAAARARGEGPGSEAAREAVERYVVGLARAAGKEPTEAMRRGVRERFAAHDPRASRYWELVSIMNGTPPPAVGNVDDWRWIAAAVLHHLA